MSTRELNIVLLVIAAIGALLGFMAVRRHGQMLAECHTLEKRLGRFVIDDPDKIHVVALETGEDRHFAWRVYIPPNLDVAWKDSTGTNFSRMSSVAAEFIAHIRLYDDDNGGLTVSAGQDGGVRGTSGRDTHLTDLPQVRWEDVRIEQLGTEGPTTVDSNEVATLVRVTGLDHSSLFDIRFGTDRAFKRVAAKKAGNK